MANLTDLNLLGGFIPDVYFDKFTLESSGLPAVEDDPHIEHAREIESRAAFRRALEESRTLNVGINLNLRDTLGDDLLTSFLDDEDIKRYFGVRLIQIENNKDLIERFLAGSTNLGEITKEIASLDGVQSKMISLNDIAISSRKGVTPTRIRGRSNDINNFSRGVNDDGSSVYDVPLKARFVVKNIEPESLAYIAYPTFDLETLQESIPGISLEEADILTTLQSRLITEIVIDGGAVVDRSFVFKTEDDDVWDGAFFEVNGSYFTGNQSDDIDHEPLTIVEVPNNKVQDFRDIDKVRKKVSDSSIVRDFADRFSKLQLSEDYFNKNRVNKNYFTDLCITPNKDGSASFIFGVNLKSFLQDNSAFPFLYNTEAKRDLQALLNTSRILNLQVFRRRVKSDVVSNMRLSSEYGNKVVFDKEEAVVMIARGAVNDDGKFRSLEGSIKFVDLLTDNPDIIHFEGKDEDLADQSFGTFQYYVVLEVEEPSAKVLSASVEELEVSSQDLSDYLTLAESPGSYDYNVDKFTEKFYEIYNVNHAKKVEAAVINLIATLKLLDKEYFAGGSNITLPFGSKPILNNDILAVSRLYGMVEPSRANITSIRQFEALVQEILNKLRNLVGSTLKGGSTSTNPAPSLGGASKSKVGSGTRGAKILEVEKYFNQVIDAQFPKETGYDYLNIAKEVADLGLKNIKFAAFDARASEETLKYFKAEDADVNLASNYKVYTSNDSIDRTKLAYFSPATVSIEGEKKVTTVKRNRRNSMSYNKADADIRSYNKGVTVKKRASKADKKTPEESETSDTLLGIAATLNIQQVNFVETESSGTVPALNYASFLGVFNAGESVVVDSCFDESKEEMTQDGLALLIGVSNAIAQSSNGKTENRAPYKTYSLQNDKNALDKNENLDASSLPNHFKALFLSSVGKNENLVEDLVNPDEETKEIQDPVKFSNFNMNYQNLVKVEALLSYNKNTEEEAQAKSPSWQTMNYDIKNEAVKRRKGAKILCRLKRAEFPEFGVVQDPALYLPVFDSYFILSLDEEEEDDDIIRFNYDTSALDFKTEAERMLEEVRKESQEIPRQQTFTVVAKKA